MKKNTEYEAVWFQDGNNPVMLADGAKTAGGAFRRLFTVHRKLIDEGVVRVLTVRQRLNVQAGFTLTELMMVLGGIGMVGLVTYIGVHFIRKFW